MSSSDSKNLTLLASFPLLNPNPVIEVSLDGRIKFANQAADRLFPALRSLGLKHPYLSHLESIATPLAGGKRDSFRIEVRVEDRWYEQTAHYAPDTGCIRIFGFDITSRKRAEAALQASEERFRMIAESSADLIFQLDLEGRITYCSPAVHAYGYRLAQIMHRSFASFVPPHELNRAADALHRVNAGESISLFEISVLKADGSAAECEVSATPVMMEGRVVGIQGIARNITERKRAEEAIRQSREDLDRAQEVGQMGWWRLDTRQNVLTWSDENHRIFGIPKGTPLTYEAFLDTVLPDDREYVDRMWKASLQGAPYDIEHRIVADGRVKWVREKAYLEFSEDAALLGGFGITQDITAKKRAEEELRRAKETLELRVAERTEELVQSNRQMEEEIAERVEAEKHLTAMNSLLKLFSATFRRKGYLEAVVELLKSWCECESIGIRLIDEQGNMPYGASIGFSSEFLEQESCVAIDRHSCACTRIAGKAPIPADAAFISPDGSFVCNDTSRLTKQSKKSRAQRYRGVCVAEGYLSLAVIPVLYREKVLGVIHLADRRSGRFSRQIVELIESATPLIGEALHRFNIEEALVVSRERLRNLSSHLQAVGEEERIKIAREIHDELGQALTAAGLELSRIRKKGKLPAAVKSALESVSGLLDGAVGDVQRICSELRPRVLDHLGLQAAIEWQAKNFSHRTGIGCSCDLAPIRKKLPHDVATALFRIVQEALTNVARHARCSEAVIRMAVEDRTLVLSVEDNGKGTTRQRLFAGTSYGVLGIRERAHGLGGTAVFRTAKGRGTAVTVKIPLFTRRTDA